MTNPDITVPLGQIHWFGDSRPAELTEPCAHDCRHIAKRVAAWGDSDEHYELIECLDCGCRVWRAHERAIQMREFRWAEPYS